MSLSLYYRIDGKNPPIPSSDIVVGVPLSMLQIDANWKSVSNAVDSIEESLETHSGEIAEKAPTVNPQFSGYMGLPTSTDDYPTTLPLGSVYFNTKTNTVEVLTEDGWRGLGTNEDLSFYLPLGGGNMYGTLEGIDANFRGVLRAYNPDFKTGEGDSQTQLERVVTDQWAKDYIDDQFEKRLGVLEPPSESGENNVYFNIPNGTIIAGKFQGDFDAGVLTNENISQLSS